MSYSKFDKLNLFFTERVFNLRTWIELLILNAPIFAGPLWFISALIYCHITYMFTKDKKNKFIDFAIILWGIGISLCVIFPVCYNEEIYYLVYRNFVFFGWPCYFIGIKIAKMKIEKHNNKYIRFFIISLIISLIENIILNNIRPDMTFEYYISSVLVSTSLIMLAISYSDIIKDNNLFAKLGRKYSIYIYIFHFMILQIVFYFLKRKILK